jgi:hypothetical protein
MSDCPEKFLSMWDTHPPSGSRFPRRRRRYIFMILRASQRLIIYFETVASPLIPFGNLLQGAAAED